MLNPAVSQKKLLWKPKKPLFFWWIWGVSPVIGISAYQILTEFNVFIPKIEVVFDHWQILERGKKMESSPFCWMFVWSIFGDFWGARTLELQSKQSRHHNFLPVCCQVLKSLIQPTSSQEPHPHALYEQCCRWWRYSRNDLIFWWCLGANMTSRYFWMVVSNFMFNHQLEKVMTYPSIFASPSGSSQGMSTHWCLREDLAKPTISSQTSKPQKLVSPGETTQMCELGCGPATRLQISFLINDFEGCKEVYLKVAYVWTHET